jgi:hypothetical protein
LAYNDDRQVRLRVAAILDLGAAGEAEPPALEQLDLSGAPEAVAYALDDLLAGRGGPGSPQTRSFTYIELGPLGSGMLRFNIAAGAAPGGREP